jgi:hypothetical protein
MENMRGPAQTAKVLQQSAAALAARPEETRLTVSAQPLMATYGCHFGLSALPLYLL